VSESEVEVFHAYTRCVRRAFLCGDGPLTGKNFDHRKQWVGHGNGMEAVRVFRSVRGRSGGEG